jgi:hypothetical protein
MGTVANFNFNCECYFLWIVFVVKWNNHNSKKELRAVGPAILL